MNIWEYGKFKCACSKVFSSATYRRCYKYRSYLWLSIYQNDYFLWADNYSTGICRYLFQGASQILLEGLRKTMQTHREEHLERKLEALKAKDPVRFRRTHAVVTPMCRIDIFHFPPRSSKNTFILSSSVCSLQMVTPWSQRHWIQTWKTFNACHEQLREIDFKTAKWSNLSFTRHCTSWKADCLQAMRLTYLTSNFRDASSSSSTKSPTNQFSIKASNFRLEIYRYTTSF